MGFITIGVLPLTIRVDLDAPTRLRVLRVLHIFSSDPPSSFCLKRQSVLWSATDSERSRPITRRNNRSCANCFSKPGSLNRYQLCSNRALNIIDGGNAFSPVRFAWTPANNFQALSNQSAHDPHPASCKASCSISIGSGKLCCCKFFHANFWSPGAQFLGVNIISNFSNFGDLVQRSPITGVM